MASVITPGASDVAGVWTTYILRQFVPGLKANLFFADYAEPASIPKGTGGYVARWNVPTMREGTTTALTDGTVSAPTNMITITNVEATIADHGEWFTIGDLAKETQVTGTLDVYKDMVTYAGATAIDRLIINELDGTTNFLHAGDTTTQGLTLTGSDTLTAQDIAVTGSFFRVNNAVGWSNIANDYMLAIHPDSELDLVTDVTTTRLSWSEVNKYVPAGFEQLRDNHRFVGRLAGVTVLRTTMIATLTENVAAYQNLATARFGVGWLGLGQNGPKSPSIKMKSEGGTYDPLDQMHTLGWKVRAVSRLLDSSRALVVYSAI